MYFGLDFLVEADIAAALKVTGDDRETRHAVGRQADCIFEPFMRRVWVRAGDDKAVDHPGLVAWLDRPYVPDREDINLNPTRIGPLYDLFGGIAGFADAARAAETISRRELARVTDLASRCEEAQKRAAQAAAVQSAQAQARQAAGRLVTDTKSYLDRRPGGRRAHQRTGQPHIMVMAVACIVRGNLVMAKHGG